MNVKCWTRRKTKMRLFCGTVGYWGINLVILGFFQFKNSHANKIQSHSSARANSPRRSHQINKFFVTCTRKTMFRFWNVAELSTERGKSLVFPPNCPQLIRMDSHGFLITKTDSWNVQIEEFKCKISTVKGLENKCGLLCRGHSADQRTDLIFN